MAELADPFGLVFDYVDDETGMNLDVVPLDDGAVQIRVLAPGKVTTRRLVTLRADEAAQLQLALAGHLRANELRDRIDELTNELDDAQTEIFRQNEQIRQLRAASGGAQNKEDRT